MPLGLTCERAQPREGRAAALTSPRSLLSSSFFFAPFLGPSLAYRVDEAEHQRATETAALADGAKRQLAAVLAARTALAVEATAAAEVAGSCGEEVDKGLYGLVAVEATCAAGPLFADSDKRPLSPTGGES